MNKRPYNINYNFYETMMFLLIETLKKERPRITGDIRTFFKEDNNTLSFIIGKDYEYKKLRFKKNYFSIKLKNNKGKFFNQIVYYNSVIGFSSEAIYMVYKNHNYDYIYPDQHNALPSKISNLFEEQIKYNLENTCKDNNSIRITFFEYFPGLEIPKHLNNGDRLLVLVLEKKEWSFKIEKEGIRLFFQGNNYKIFLPYNSIVTYFNVQDSLFLNRNIKVVPEDFMEESSYTCDENLIYVNFKELLDNNEDNDLINFFANLGNNYIYTNNKIVEYSDNLIVGDFEKKIKE